MTDNSPPFATRVSRVVLTLRYLAAEAVMSNIRGGSELQNKPAGCGASEAYVWGPD
jgi:hypothetical protein